MTNSANQVSNTSTATSDKISKTWQTKFALIDKAGGPDWRRLRKLTNGERRKLSFNILAFIFGPLYYLAKGMWRKALTLTAAGIAATLGLNYLFTAVGIDFQIPNGVVVMCLAASRANLDYYKKIILNDKQWW